jgi:hypothetical protein
MRVVARLDLMTVEVKRKRKREEAKVNGIYSSQTNSVAPASDTRDYTTKTR